MMQLRTAERIKDGKGWYWPPNARKAHYYDTDNRTLCGAGMVLVLPPGLDGFWSDPSRDDCLGCKRKVLDARAVIAARDAEEAKK